MPGYGPQEEERYAQQKAEFEARHPAGEKRVRRGASSRMIHRPARSAAGGEEILEPVSTSSTVTVKHQQAQNYAAPNYQTQVVLALISAFLMDFVANISRAKQSNGTGTGQYISVTAWFFIATILIIASSFRGPDKLAAAFAWLIFIAILFADGIDAFKIVTTDPLSFFVGGSGTGSNAGQGSASKVSPHTA